MTKIFREYENTRSEVKEHYKNLRTNQTLSYVSHMYKKYFVFQKKINIWEAFALLDNFVDVSDPDITLPNIHHLFQTAESIRNEGLPDWLQLTGLIHDLGKIIYMKGCDEDGTSIKEQWGIVGDTFIVGCHIPKTCVYPEFNVLNLDNIFDRQNTNTGIYNKNCGLDKCHCSFGHDEYLYRLLKFNECTLPEEALYIIRYHSLYPWHTHNDYKELTNKKDEHMLKWVQLFNKHDLYTKNEKLVDIDGLKEYYNKIINKYFKSSDIFW